MDSAWGFSEPVAFGDNTRYPIAEPVWTAYNKHPVRGHGIDFKLQFSMDHAPNIMMLLALLKTFFFVNCLNHENLNC